MYKTILRQTQPVFYRVIENAFKLNKIPHAYLLIGEQTKDAVNFLAMSLLCDDDLLACEKCLTCYKVNHDEYVDIIRYDGNKETIKKGHIEHIQQTFAKSSVEGRGKIYILENIDHSTTEAMNSLLKVLEEPVAGVYAIFTCVNESQVLPTIVSRCQTIHMRPIDKLLLRNELEEEIVDEEIRNVVSELSKDKKEALEIYDEEVMTELMIEAFNFVEDDLFKHENLIINTQTHVLKKYKDKQTVQLFLRIILLIYKEMLYKQENIFVKHQELIQKDIDVDLIKKIELILETIYLLDSNANVLLLMDRLMYRL